MICRAPAQADMSDDVLSVVVTQSIACEYSFLPCHAAVILTAPCFAIAGSPQSILAGLDTLISVRRARRLVVVGLLTTGAHKLDLERTAASVLTHAIAHFTVTGSRFAIIHVSCGLGPTDNVALRGAELSTPSAAALSAYLRERASLTRTAGLMVSHDKLPVGMHDAGRMLNPTDLAHSIHVIALHRAAV